MNIRRTAIIAIALLSCMFIAAGVLSNGNSDIEWWVFGGGGGQVSGGEVTLNASLGQPIIGISSGDSISLEAGFWPGT